MMKAKLMTAALVVMLMTVFVPAGLFLWYSGALVVDQIVNLCGFFRR